MHLYHHQFVVVTWPSRCLSSLSERHVGFAVVPSLRLTLADEISRSGAAGGQAPASMTPRSSGFQCAPSGGPWWTEPPAVHEPWTESTISSYCKIILKQENPHHLANNPLYLSIIKPQSTFLLNRTLGFKNISRYTPSHFQKLQIGPYKLFSSYPCNRNSKFSDSFAKIIGIPSSFFLCIHITHVYCILLIHCLCLLHDR
jgi:hypothetical protein